MVENIVVLGATGNVGTQTVLDILEYDGGGNGHSNPSRIVGMANSSGIIMNAQGIDNAGGLVRDRDSFDAAISHRYGEKDLSDTLQQALNDEGLNGNVVVLDVTALKGEAILKLHQQVLATRNRLATANKNPLALSSTHDFQELAGFPGMYDYSATVMAGGGAISWLRQAYNIREDVYSIEGMFSGTLGYICSLLDEGMKFSAAVRMAFEKNYTEPHPHDDCNGLDVLRKLLILARTPGLDVSEEDVELTPLVPEDLFREDPEEYLQAIEASSLDDDIEGMRQSALKEGRVLRFIASLDNTGAKPVLKVGLQPVDKDSELGQLQGTANLVKIVTSQRAPAESPHVIKSKGAGVERTASEVRASAANLIPGGGNVYGGDRPVQAS